MNQDNVIVSYRDNGRLGPDEVLFNSMLSLCQMMVEWSIGLLKGNFRTWVDNPPMWRADLIPRCIIVCYILHNMCIDNNDFADIMEFEPEAPHYRPYRFKVDAGEKQRGA